MTSERGDDRWVGLVLVIAGATLLASKGIFAKILYARGVTVDELTSVRSVIAYPGFVAIALMRGGLRPLTGLAPGLLIKAAFAGFICYYVGAWVDFYALTLIDASVERALLFSYPAMLVVYFWIARGRRPGWRTLGATSATYLGIAMTVGVLQPDVFDANLVGAALVLFCGATIAYYFVATADVMKHVGSAQMNVVAMGAAALAFAIHFQVRAGWDSVEFDAVSWSWLAGFIVFATVLPLYFVAEGVRRIGPERAAIASTVGPAATTLMAFALLGERLSPDQLAGIVLIMAGILVVELRRSKQRALT